MGTRRYLLAALVVAVVVVAAVVAVTPWDAPRPLPAAASAERFSSGRAMEMLRRIAGAPRAIGSPQSAVVRRLIVRRLDELGLTPHVQEAVVVSRRDPRVAGLVHNVMGRLPGNDPSRAVLLVAHYDSVPTAAGAADDGSGVAALLETARALRAGSPPKNDVIFLFTDGEERGLLGSQAFLEQDPWAYAAGVVLNFDSPGSSSPTLMYETSPQNGRLVAAYLAGGHAYGSSLMYEVSRRQPVVSDFRPFVARGIPGMTFGMLDGPAYNHTAYDSLATFREAGLQHQGETALALARRLGDADLWNVRAPDVVYFNLVGGFAVSYPVAWVVPFTVLGVTLFAGAVTLAARRRLLSLHGVAAAVLGTAGTLAASLFVVAIAWAMYRTAYEERVWTGTEVVISDWYRLGLVLLATSVVLVAYAALLRRVRTWDLAVVALAWWAGGSVLVGLVFPGASFLLTWPLVAGSLGLGAAALVDRSPDGGPVGALFALAASVPGLLLMSSAVYLLLMSAGLKQGVTVAAVWLLAGLLMLPLAVVVRVFRLWLPGALAVAGFAVLFAVGSVVAFDTEHPKFTAISYRLAPDGTAKWESLDRPDDYTLAFLGEHARSQLALAYYPQFGPRIVTSAPAPAFGVRGPTLELVSDEVDRDRRTVKVRMRPGQDAAVLSLLVQDVVGTLTAGVEGYELAGRDTTLLDESDVRWSFDFYAPPQNGVVVTLDFAAGPSVLLRTVGFAYGLPGAVAGSYPSRPGGMLPGRLGDGTLSEALLRLPATIP